MDAGSGETRKLEIEQDLAYQRRFWKIQRAGWILMACAIAAALLGLFGHGLLSHIAAGTPGDRLWLEYERFGRYESPTMLTIHMKTGADPERRAHIRIDRDYLLAFQIKRIVPEPAQVALSSDGALYTFAFERADESGMVIFYVMPQQIGSVHGRIGSGDIVLPVQSFIFP